MKAAIESRALSVAGYAGMEKKTEIAVLGRLWGGDSSRERRRKNGSCCHPGLRV